MTASPRDRRPGGAPARAGSEDGIAAVELALALPFLVLLLIGLVDVGTLAYSHMQLAAAARAGTQIGLVGPATAAWLGEVRAAVEAAAPAASGERELRVELRCQCQSGAPVGCTVTCPDGPRAAFLEIAVAQPVRLVLPYPGLGSEARIAYATVARLY